MEVDIKKFLSVLFQRRKLVVWIVVGFFVFSVVVSFLIPKRYQSSAKVLPPAEEQGAGALLLSGLQQELGLQVPGMSVFQTPFDLFIGILESNTIAQRVVKSLDLVKAYRAKTESKAIGIVKKQIDVRPLPEGVLVITAETRSPELSARIANTYLEELDRFLKETNMTRGRNTRVFVEKRLGDAERDLKAAEDSLRVFQQRNKTVALEDETRKAVENYATLKAQAVSKQTELDVLLSYATVDNPLYLSTKKALDELNRRLKEFEDGGGQPGFGVGFGVALTNMPEVAQEYLRRLRDVKIQEEIYTLLMQQYEQAKILEARDTPTVIILESAVPESVHSWPKKSVIVGLSIILGLIVGIVSAVVADWWARLKRRPEEYAELQRMWGMVKNDFRFLRREKNYDTTRTPRKPRS